MEPTSKAAPSPADTAEQARALELLRGARSLLLVGHVRPDGDCLGSQGALASGLRALGKHVRILNADRPGPTFDYLTRALDYGVYGGGEVPTHDVLVLLDFNELSRTGPMADALARAASRKLVIDHHPFAGKPWWDAAYVDVSAAATGALVVRVLRALGAPLDALAAQAAFTALVTDTGWFRYSNTDRETLTLAGELVALGADPARLYGSLYQRRPLDEPAALARVLARNEYFLDGRLALVDQPLPLGGESALDDGDPVLDFLRAVECVEVVLYLREVEAGTCKLSARSKTDFDVNALARQFGGGGHKKAAGATIPGRLDEVRARVAAAACAALAAFPREGRAR